MLDKWAPLVENDGTTSRHFDLGNEKLGGATVQERRAILDALDAYWNTLDDPMGSSSFQVLDVALRLKAGTRSLGVRRFYVLIREEDSDVLRILDVKEQSKPSPYHSMGSTMKQLNHEHVVDSPAKAVVIATRTMCVPPDPLAGWLQMGCTHYSVQERSPWKGSYPALLEEATGKFQKVEARQ